MENSLKKLFIQELKDLYSAESQITTALPEMASAASSSDLKMAFRSHLNETKNQLQRLDQVFAILDESPEGEKCEGMEGLINEGKKIIKDDLDSETKDIGLAAAAQKVEHYEMAGYQAVKDLADRLGFEDEAHLLAQTLSEEKETSDKLNQMMKKMNTTISDEGEEEW